MWKIANSLLILRLIVLLFPFAATLCVRYSTLSANESAQASSWIAHRRQIKVIILFTVAVWWALWNQSEESNAGGTFSEDWIKHFLFLALPLFSIAVTHLTCYVLDRSFLSSRWTPIDLLRLACWNTVSPSAALLFVASGFDAIYLKHLTAVFWIFGAGLLAIIGRSKARSAEGIKQRLVKSGEAYKRAFTMAKIMQAPLKRVYVIPPGRGHLTNAFAGISGNIAVTENYSRFLNTAQLDCVLGHELWHVKARHGRKKLFIALSFYSGTALIYLLLPEALSSMRPLLDIFAVFGPVLALNFHSRCCEYDCDKASAEFTNDPESAIRALANLYRITQTPIHCGWFMELFMTHPALTRRVQAIGKIGSINADRMSELVECAAQENSISS